MTLPDNKKFYIQRVGKKGTIYLTSGFYNDRPNWNYVRVDSLKLPMFLRQIKTGIIDVADYGEVLFSGWGKEPPEEIRRKIEEMQT